LYQYVTTKLHKISYSLNDKSNLSRFIAILEKDSYLETYGITDFNFKHIRLEDIFFKIVDPKTSNNLNAGVSISKLYVSPEFIKSEYIFLTQFLANIKKRIK